MRAKPDAAAWLQRHSDLAVAALVVGVVGMMVVPLPTFLLDVLISLNLTLSVVVLMVAIYVPDVTRFASFPAVLLLTTLFRLGLNISSTRLILLQADAGNVIRSFGGFVVRGNFVVGVILFVIITVVQYIVISRGAERVAEVAARFALDAMPGRQLAIDADMRAGLLGPEEARTRRASLGRESQLYGAMDGAMKFVKGDAIAGIIIAAVSIVGGLLVGVGQRGLPAGQALEVYGLLTIGDGLVSQLPALVLSTAAGLVVTRVASDDGGHLGQDLAAQIAAQPKALAIAAGLLAVLALIPGLPTAPFLLLAAATGILAWALLRRARAHRAQARRPTGPATGVVIEVPRRLLDSGELAEELARDLHDTLGVTLPPVEVRDGAPGRWRLMFADLVVTDGAAQEADATERDIATALTRYAHELIGIQEAQSLLDGLARTHPALVREAQKSTPTPLFAEVLRRLVAERVSILDLKTIVEAVVERARQTGDKDPKDPGALAEHARTALRRQLTRRYADAERTLSAWLLDPMIEDAVRGAVTRAQAGAYLALEPDLAKDIRAAVKRALGSAAAPVVVTAGDIRRFVKQLVGTVHRDAAVLSYQELEPEVTLSPRGRITVVNEADEVEEAAS